MLSSFPETVLKVILSENSFYRHDFERIFILLTNLTHARFVHIVAILALDRILFGNSLMEIRYKFKGNVYCYAG